MSSYQLRVLINRPSAAWSLDDTFVDISGGGADAAQIGSINRHPALVAGEGFSMIISSDGQIEYPNNVFTNNRGPKPFSLEAWVKPLRADVSTTILAHGFESGLLLEDSVIKFSVPFDLETITVSYPLDALESHHVVGVFDQSKVALYINGALASMIEIDPEVLESGMSDLVDDSLFSGLSSDSGDFLVIDAPALYSYSMSGEQVENHFRWGRDVRSAEEIVATRSGVYHSFSDDRAEIYIKLLCDSAESWSIGLTENVDITDEGVRPSIEEIENDGQPTGVFESLPGKIELSIPFAETNPFAPIKIEWLGSGNFVVEASFDGSDWEPVANHSLIEVVADLDEDDAPHFETMFVRVVFDGGVVDDESVLRTLRVVAYSSATVHASANSRPASVDNIVIASDENQVIEYNDRKGAAVQDGLIAIRPDVNNEPDEILSPNPTFEADLDGWIATNATLERSEDEFRDGIASCALIPDGSTATAVFSSIADPGIEVEQSRSYSWTAWCMSHESISVAQSISWYDQDGVLIDTDSSGTTVLNPGEWINLSMTEESPSGAERAAIAISILGLPDDPDILYIDDAYFSVPVDNEEPETIMALDMWIRFNDLGDEFILLDTRSTGNTSNPTIQWDGLAMSVSGTWSGRAYVNGEYIPDLTDYEFVSHVWYHLVVTFPDGVNPWVTIGGDYTGVPSEDSNFQLGHLGMYNTFNISTDTPSNDLTARRLMNEYLGIVNASVTDSSEISMSDEDEAIMYAFDWAMVSGD